MRGGDEGCEERERGKRRDVRYIYIYIYGERGEEEGCKERRERGEEDGCEREGKKGDVRETTNACSIVYSRCIKSVSTFLT